MTRSQPFFTHHIFCCLNQREPGNSRGCCASKDAEPLFEYFKQRVKTLGIDKTRVNRAGCLDRCADGPTVVIYPEGIWYSLKTKADIDRVIASHLQQNQPVESLMITPASNT